MDVKRIKEKAGMEKICEDLQAILFAKHTNVRKVHYRHSRLSVALPGGRRNLPINKALGERV